MKNADTLQFAHIAAAIEYLYNHFREQPALEEVAAHVHISPAHLQRQFQNWAGVSPKKMLQYISIENAKRVLQQQGSVQTAAFESGLSGSSRLHDLFVSIEGMTPGEYKNGGAGLEICYTFAPGPFGDVLVASTSKGICWLAFADQHQQALQDLAAEYPQARLTEAAYPLHEKALAALGGQTAQTIPLHLKGTPFQLKVWQALLQIPAGRLKSYGGLAADISQARAARAVGSAVGSNPVAVLIPCHRVIRESGISAATAGSAGAKWPCWPKNWKAPYELGFIRHAAAARGQPAALRRHCE